MRKVNKGWAVAGTLPSLFVCSCLVQELGLGSWGWSLELELELELKL
jgi:hypothetical protein